VRQDDLPPRIQDYPKIEETIPDFRVSCLGLCDNERVVCLREIAKCISFFSRNIDSAPSGKLDVVKVKYLVIETL